MSAAPEWRRDAACADANPALFFTPARAADAKRICAGCPAIMECRDYARRTRQQGVWGGEDDLERAKAGFQPTNTATHMLMDRTG